MKYPFDPVLAHLREPIVEFERRLGVSHGSVQRWRERGLSEANADRCAAALGMDPYGLWPEMLDAAIAPIMRECEIDDCHEVFVLTRSHKRFCSANCRNRSPQALVRRAAAQKAKRAAETPEQREARIEANRAYKARAKRSIHIANADYYRRTADKQKADRRARYWAAKDEAA